MSRDPLRNFALLVLGALLVLVLNIWVIVPGLSRVAGDGAGVVAYTLIRVAVMIGLGYGLTQYAQRRRFQVLGTVAFVELIDQLVLKGISFMTQVEGVEPLTVLYGMAVSYMMFLPMILIFAFVGSEISQRKVYGRRRQGP